MSDRWREFGARAQCRYPCDALRSQESHSLPLFD